MPLLPPEILDDLRDPDAAPKPASDCQIVYWGMNEREGARQLPEHLPAALSRHFRVLYVRLAPVSSALSTRGGALPSVVERRDERLTILRPRALSPGRLAFLGHHNDRRATELVWRHLDVAKPVVLWLTHPNQMAQVGRYAERLVCFDSMDYHAAFKRGRARERTAREEAALLRRADLVFASSDDLQARAEAAGARSTLVPNAGDFERFSLAATQPLPMPEELQAIPRPRLLFSGTLGPWLETDWLADLARARPRWSVVLIGPPAGADLRLIASLPNVHQLGWRPYESLPAYLQHADVCLLPRAAGELTRAMDPAKVYEYLAAAKPVVATPLAELTKYGDLIDVADTGDQAVAAIEGHLRAADSETRRRARLAFAARHTWSKRADTVRQVLEAALREGSDDRVGTID